MTVNRQKLAHEVLALIQSGVHSVYDHNANTSVDESELTPEIGDELILAGSTLNEEGNTTFFSVRIFIGADDFEIEDWD